MDTPSDPPCPNCEVTHPWRDHGPIDEPALVTSRAVDTPTPPEPIHDRGLPIAQRLSDAARPDEEWRGFLIAHARDLTHGGSIPERPAEPLREALGALLDWADEVNATAVENDYWPIGDVWDAARAALQRTPETRPADDPDAIADQGIGMAFQSDDDLAASTDRSTKPHDR